MFQWLISAHRKGEWTNTSETFRNMLRTGHKCVSLLTGKEGHVSMFGIVRTASHPTDLLSQSLQGVRLGSQRRSEVKRSQNNAGFENQTMVWTAALTGNVVPPVGGGKGLKEENESWPVNMEGLHKNTPHWHGGPALKTAVTTSVYLRTSTNNLWMKLWCPNSNWEELDHCRRWTLHV